MLYRKTYKVSGISDFFLRWLHQVGFQSRNQAKKLMKYLELWLLPTVYVLDTSNVLVYHLWLTWLKEAPVSCQPLQTIRQCHSSAMFALFFWSGACGEPGDPAWHCIVIRWVYRCKHASSLWFFAWSTLASISTTLSSQQSFWSFIRVRQCLRSMGHEEWEMELLQPFHLITHQPYSHPPKLFYEGCH